LSDEQKSHLEVTCLPAAVEDHLELYPLLLKPLSQAAVRRAHIQEGRPLLADSAASCLGMIAQAFSVQFFDHLVDERIIESPYIRIRWLYFQWLFFLGRCTPEYSRKLIPT
jgi:hypothetical protein